MKLIFLFLLILKISSLSQIVYKNQLRKKKFKWNISRLKNFSNRLFFVFFNVIKSFEW